MSTNRCYRWPGSQQISHNESHCEPSSSPGLHCRSGWKSISTSAPFTHMICVQQRSRPITAWMLNVCVNSKGALFQLAMAGWFPNVGFHLSWDSHDLRHICVGARKASVTTDKLKDHFMMDYIRHRFLKNGFLSHKGQRSHNSHSGPSIKWASSHQKVTLPKLESVRRISASGIMCDIYPNLKTLRMAGCPVLRAEILFYWHHA